MKVSTPRRDLNVKGSLITLAVLLLLGIVAWLVTQRDSESLAQSQVGGPVQEQFAPGDRDAVMPFRARLLSGATFDSADLAGRVAVFNVWGSWCGPCRKEAPALARVARETVNETTFVGINVRDNDASARAFERGLEVPYDSVVSDDSDQALPAFGGALATAAVPSTVVVDREGRIAARVVGIVTYRTLKALVDEVVAEP